jgi:hypothetical protein
MTINEILLFGLSEPEYSRVEFWQLHQRKSEFSELIFYRKMMDSLHNYSTKIENRIIELKIFDNGVTDVQLALLIETAGKLSGHCGRVEIESLKRSLGEWFNIIENKSNNKPNKNFTVEYIDTYKNEVTRERINEFKLKIGGIESQTEKLAFCKNELKEYLQNIPAETLAASGNIGVSNPIFFDRFIQIEIDAINAEIEKEKLVNINSFNLAAIFNDTNNAFHVCKELLEDLEITISGKPNTKKGRVGKLTGLITAIKETPYMLKIQNPTDKQLLEYFNDYLKTTYKTFSKRNEDYLSSVDDAKRYIKNHFKK